MLRIINIQKQNLDLRINEKKIKKKGCLSTIYYQIQKHKTDFE